MSADEKLLWLLAIIACPFLVLIMPDERVSDDND